MVCGSRFLLEPITGLGYPPGLAILPYFYLNKRGVIEKLS